MIALPIVDWLAGEEAVTVGISLGVALQFVTVLTVLVRDWGWRRTLSTVALVALLAWSLEAVGSRTGIPFGDYGYTDRLQPQIGHVPVLIPIAWMMMLPPAWAVGQRLVGRKRFWPFALVSALAFVVWDLFLDPQMVAWGLWLWAEPGGYFGIPWVNFVGWFLGAVAITALVRPQPVSTPPLLLIYAITWALESVGLAFFWGQPGPAAVGCVAMGGMLLLALTRSADQK